MSASVPIARRIVSGLTVRHWQFRVKVFALLLVPLMSTGLLGYAGHETVLAVKAKTSDLYHRRLLPTQQLDAVRADMKDARIALLSYAAERNAPDREAPRAALAAAGQRFTADVTRYRDGAVDLGEVEQLRAVWAQYMATVDRLLGLGDNDDWSRFDRERKSVAVPLAEQADKLVIALVEAERVAAARSLVQANALYQKRLRIMIGLLLATVLLSVLFGVVITRSLARPVRRVVTAMKAVASGDLTVHVDANRGDEAGQLGRSVNETVEALRRMVSGVTGSAEALSSASGDFRKLSDWINEAARRSAGEARAMADATERVAASIQSVATGAEQMNGSITEISRGSHQAAEVAAEAVRTSAQTNGTVAALGESGKEISDVVRAIAAIAGQTNLLALNATIEAARAGAAGRGFAVVAGEVKDLAQETAQATADISQRVERIQAGTGRAVAAIAEVGDIIERINDFQLTIASAVEQQTCTTAEMTRAVASAATGVDRIAHSAAEVADAAEQTATEVADSQHRVRELAEMAGDLQQLVAHFRV